MVDEFEAQDLSQARTPPQDMAAEQSVLGAMLVSQDAIGEVVEIIEARDFYRPANGTIFETILSLNTRGEPADAITVAAELDKRGQLTRIGGPAYLTQLVGSVLIAANATYYAQIVRDKAVLRRLVDASVRIAQLGYQGQGDVNDIVDLAQQTVYGVSGVNSADDYQPLSKLMDPTFDEIDAIRSHGGTLDGVPTGFADLDRLTNGLHAGQMIIIAARPGVGKSTLGLDFARSAAIGNNMTTAFFSLEMTKTELVMRLLSAEASVPLHHIRTGSLTDDENDRLQKIAGQIFKAPLFIDDSPNLTMMQIRAKARRLHQANNLKLVIIDYMQLMSSGKRVESRQLEVSEFSRQVKLLAKELGIPVVALSQLNRGPESRGSERENAPGSPKGRPQLSDLRESGSLEQDADVVILLYRED
ncbi:MAG: replicative DNA helicase, partial [Propionibacteriaceae bacterium]|nr:replicative DNA helicase [Propionibacteriaceae bacterium]